MGARGEEDDDTVDAEIRDLVPVGRSGALDAGAIVDLASARDYVRASRAESSLSVYRRAFKHFDAWCLEQGAASLPAAPETLAAYLAAEADRGLSPSTIEVKAAAIGAAHDAAEALAPNASVLVRKTLSGIRRVKGGAVLPKDPLTAGEVTKIVDEISPSAGLVGLRDRAVILLGFAAALRRSELAALDIDHIEFVDEGLLVTISTSKGDQESEGQMIAVPKGTHHCPVAALKDWLDAASILKGPVFRGFAKNRRLLERGISGKTVARIIKLRAARAGFDADDIGGHSLRAGFLTSAAKNRANLWKMAEVSRHKSIDMLRAYVRSTELFDDHAGKGML